MMRYRYERQRQLLHKLVGNKKATADFFESKSAFEMPIRKDRSRNNH